MINTGSHNDDVLTGFEHLFPGQIKVHFIDRLKNDPAQPSLLHRHFRDPLTKAMEKELAYEIAAFLVDKETDETYSFFYRSLNKGGGYEWHIVSARLNRDNNSLPKEVVLFSYDLNLLGEQKQRLYRVLENDDFFKGNFNKVALLTKKEKEIATLLVQGMSSQEIAAACYISVHTVNTHRKNINDKLGIHNFAGLLRYADVFDFSATIAKYNH